jgi:hypothetical protein
MPSCQQSTGNLGNAPMSASLRLRGFGLLKTTICRLCSKSNLRDVDKAPLALQSQAVGHSGIQPPPARPCSVCYAPGRRDSVKCVLRRAGRAWVRRCRGHPAEHGPARAEMGHPQRHSASFLMPPATAEKRPRSSQGPSHASRQAEIEGKIRTVWHFGRCRNADFDLDPLHRK